MSTLYHNSTVIPILNKYGVTEQKKAELDALTTQVIDAQNEVDQFQAIVDSLNTKSINFNNQLSAAEANKTTALSNKEEIDNVIDSALDLLNNSKVTFDEIVLSDTEIKVVATEIKVVVDKLIYSAEVINKLSNLVIRKKALNPLISDELITMVTNAGTAANNAVSLTLVALNSVFASQATTLEAEASLSLEYLQANKLYEYLTGTSTDVEKNTSIKALLDKAYKISEAQYKSALVAAKDTTKQLNAAKANLSTATISLNSLQAGLAAANAAALAS